MSGWPALRRIVLLFAKGERLQTAPFALDARVDSQTLKQGVRGRPTSERKRATANDRTRVEHVRSIVCRQTWPEQHV